MRIVFLGTPELAVPSLGAVAERHAVTAVVCQPDRPQGRSKAPVPPPTKLWAREHNIPVNQPTKLNDGTFEAWLRSEAPEVCCLCAYGRILKQPLLDVPQRGFLNVHPSLLSRYRGTSPIQTPILLGDDVTGVTIMQLDAGMDTGDILLQETEPIRPEDTAVTLAARLAAIGAALLVRALDLLESGTARFVPQDHEKATYTKPLTKEDGHIRWAAPARQIHNLVRATVPWPMAQCRFRGQVCLIHESAILNETTDAPPGTAIRVEPDEVVVATGEGALAVRRFQAPGKRAMPMADFLRGHPVRVGETFEDP